MAETFHAWRIPTVTFQGQFKHGRSSPIFPQAELAVFPLLWRHSKYFIQVSTQIKSDNIFKHLLCNRYTVLSAGNYKSH